MMLLIIDTDTAAQNRYLVTSLAYNKSVATHTSRCFGQLNNSGSDVVQACLTLIGTLEFSQYYIVQ